MGTTGRLLISVTIALAMIAVSGWLSVYYGHPHTVYPTPSGSLAVTQQLTR